MHVVAFGTLALAQAHTGMQSDDLDTASGHMAAQQATSPVPPTRSPVPEVILFSPATLVVVGRWRSGHAEPK